METSDKILNAYIKDRRTRNFAGYLREDLGYLVRQTPTKGNGGGWVYFSDIPPSKLDHVIEEQTSFFRQENLNWEWKFYDFDQPDNLPIKLVDHGFARDEEEHLMVLDLKEFSNVPFVLPKNIIVEKVTISNGLEAIRQFQESIWNRDLSEHFTYISENQEIFSYYVAKDEGKVIGSGWTEYLEGSKFPELHGGAVAPTWRNKGIYSALLYARLQEITQKGHQYVTVDAAPMSHPILQRKGFVSLAISHPFHLAL